MCCLGGAHELLCCQCVHNMVGPAQIREGPEVFHTGVRVNRSCLEIDCGVRGISGREWYYLHNQSDQPTKTIPDPAHRRAERRQMCSVPRLNGASFSLLCNITFCVIWLQVDLCVMVELG